MDGHTPVTRRKARTWRITVAVGVLAAATLVLAGALVTADRFVVSSAGVLALACGWGALRLGWTAVVQSRYEHAVDRTELARAYRSLLAERSVEHQTFAAGMSTRLTQRDRVIHHLEGSLLRVEMRAIEAETTVRTFRCRLTDAEGQIAAMEDLITAARQAQAGEQALDRAAESNKPPLLGRRPSEPLRDRVVPEWADMDVDVVNALLAWEEQVGNRAGRGYVEDRPGQQA